MQKVRKTVELFATSLKKKILLKTQKEVYTHEACCQHFLKEYPI